MLQQVGKSQTHARKNMFSDHKAMQENTYIHEYNSFFSYGFVISLKRMQNHPRGHKFFAHGVIDPMPARPTICADVINRATLVHFCMYLHYE